MDIINKTLVLQLNASWLPIGQRSVREAVVCLCGQHAGDKPSMALDMEMGVDENGEQVLIYANPVDWDTWITLPIREGDLYITSSRGQIRCPLVIVACGFNRMPMVKTRVSNGNIYLRDQGVCQYSGKKLPRARLNIDHVIPRSRGGKDTFENMVLSDKEINHMKGDRLNSEVGLSLIRPPVAPRAKPASSAITEAKHDFWKPFLVST